MPSAPGTVHFGAAHEGAPVLGGLDRSFDGLPEARPARAALEFCVRLEQRAAAARTLENARPLLLIERARSGPLGAVLAKHVILARRKRLLPFVVGLLN